MYNIDFKTRMVISTTVVAIILLFSVALSGFGFWNDAISYVPYAAIGSYGYQLTDWAIYNWRQRA